MYRVVLTVDGKEHTQGLRVENDPLLKSPNLIAEDEEDEEERESAAVESMMMISVLPLACRRGIFDDEEHAPESRRHGLFNKECEEATP